jgi:hypothetical protein
MKRLLGGMILAGMFICTQGCTYLSNRGQDAMDMVDVGFTFSKDPHFALYYDFIPIIPIGYGKVEGTFAGLGGGKFGTDLPHYEESLGLILWGEERVNFGTSPEELDAMSESERNEALNFQRSGLIGMVQGPFPGTDYLISCPHYLHLGWIGGVGSPRYLEMLDFVIGWTTLDICGDDDRGEEKQKQTSQTFEKPE